MEPEIYYYPDGKIYCEEYLVNGKRHRLDGRPAFIKYYDNRNIRYEEYRINGKYHRLDGPAIIGYYENGGIAYQTYWINNHQIPKEEIDDILEQCGNDKQLLKDLLTLRYM